MYMIWLVLHNIIKIQLGIFVSAIFPLSLPKLCSFENTCLYDQKWVTNTNALISKQTISMHTYSENTLIRKLILINYLNQVFSGVI